MNLECSDVWTQILKHCNYIDIYRLKCTNRTFYYLMKFPLIKSMELNKYKQYKAQKKYSVIKVIVKAIEKYFANIYINLNNVDFKLYKPFVDEPIGNYKGNCHYTFKILYSCLSVSVEVNISLQSELNIRNCNEYTNFEIELNKTRYQLFPS